MQYRVPVSAGTLLLIPTPHSLHLAEHVNVFPLGAVLSILHVAVEPSKIKIMNTEALCAAPPEALTHSPSQMPLSCPVAPQAARRPLRLRPRGHAPRNTSLRRRTNYLEPQRLCQLRHAPNTSPGCRSCASAPSPAAARRRELRTSPSCRPHLHAIILPVLRGAPAPPRSRPFSNPTGS